MAFHNRKFKVAALAAVSAGALLLSEPAFAFHGGGGFHGGFGGGGFRGGGWGGGWHGGGWGRPGWGGGWGWGVAPAVGWGWGWGPGWGWDNGYYGAGYYGGYDECFIRRVQVQTPWGWRWRRVRYCYQ